MKKFVFNILFVVTILLSLVVSASAQSPDRVERPNVKVGDSWTYQKIDDWTGVVQEKYTLEVSGVSDKEIQLTRKSEASGGISNITETLDKNIISGISGTKGDSIRYSPHTGIFVFPLEVGKTWEAKTDYAANDRTGSYKLDIKVVGWEKVKVAGGDLMALKITAEGYYRSTQGTGSGSGSMQQTLWYAPAVKRMVKLQYEDTNWSGRPYNKITTVLVSYKGN